MIFAIIARLVIMVFGTLFPAYSSYKAVKTKNVKEYVKWMMYWIVFALFTCIETVTDVFLSWFPFYYEIKIILVIWLLSPATKGSSILYRKFVHPMLSSREQEIDDYISKAKEQSYKQVLEIGSKGMSALMQTALKGGGGLVNQIRKSYSLSDLSEQRHDLRDYESTEETDSLVEARVIRRQKHSPRRNSPRRHTTTSAIYFSEIDVRHDALATIQSVEDISSGYSSGEVLHPGQPPKLHVREGLVRTASIGGGTKPRPTRVTRSSLTTKKSESDEEEEVPLVYLNDKARFLRDLQKTSSSFSTEELSSSSSSGEEFRDCFDSDGNVTSKSENNLNNNTPIPIQSLKNEIIKNRGGKYHKKVAPSPPVSKSTTCAELNETLNPTIKATLVLKPGVVKSLGNEETKNEVFLNSPNMRRRNSNSSSPTTSKSKLDASILKWKKKIHFWQKDDSDEVSRSFWYDKEQQKSRSEEDFTKIKFRKKLLEKIKLLKED
nr:receptor expression-enhancing protein 2 isoform X2 [Onthophagus taurus]